jgi:hypothetical protein
MKIDKIVVGTTVETTMGIGKVVRVGGTYPPSVQVEITQPIPRGRVSLRPRDVLRVVPEKT